MTLSKNQANKCECRCHLPLVTTDICPYCFNGCQKLNPLINPTPVLSKPVSKIVASSDEDGENFFAVKVGNLTRLGALRAIKRIMQEECGLNDRNDREIMPRLDDLESREFWETDDEKYEGGEYESYTFWVKPDDVPVKYLGWGWVYKLYEH